MTMQTRVEVVTSESHTVWYADPFWIGVGVVTVIIILMLAIMPARRSGRTTTTVIR
jgi:formate-dependent nitrite reductase membrane component NrfD